MRGHFTRIDEIVKNFLYLFADTIIFARFFFYKTVEYQLKFNKKIKMTVSNQSPKTPSSREIRFSRPSTVQERIQKISKFVYKFFTFLAASPVYLYRAIKDRIFHTDSMLQLAVWQESTLALRTTLLAYKCLGIHTEGLSQKYITEAIKRRQYPLAATMIKGKICTKTPTKTMCPVKEALKQNHIDLLYMLGKHMPDSTKESREEALIQLIQAWNERSSLNVFNALLVHHSSMDRIKIFNAALSIRNISVQKNIIGQLITSGLKPNIRTLSNLIKDKKFLEVKRLCSKMDKVLLADDTVRAIIENGQIQLLGILIDKGISLPSKEQLLQCIQTIQSNTVKTEMLLALQIKGKLTAEQVESFLPQDTKERLDSKDNDNSDNRLATPSLSETESIDDEKLDFKSNRTDALFHPSRENEGPSNEETINKLKKYAQKEDLRGIGTISKAIEALKLEPEEIKELIQKGHILALKQLVKNVVFLSHHNTIVLYIANTNSLATQVNVVTMLLKKKVWTAQHAIDLLNEHTKTENNPALEGLWDVMRTQEISHKIVEQLIKKGNTDVLAALAKNVLQLGCPEQILSYIRNAPSQIQAKVVKTLLEKKVLQAKDAIDLLKHHGEANNNEALGSIWAATVESKISDQIVEKLIKEKDTKMLIQLVNIPAFNQHRSIVTHIANEPSENQLSLLTKFSEAGALKEQYITELIQDHINKKNTAALKALWPIVKNKGIHLEITKILIRKADIKALELLHENSLYLGPYKHIAACIAKMQDIKQQNTVTIQMQEADILSVHGVSELMHIYINQNKVASLEHFLTAVQEGEIDHEDNLLEILQKHAYDHSLKPETHSPIKTFIENNIKAAIAEKNFRSIRGFLQNVDYHDIIFETWKKTTGNEQTSYIMGSTHTPKKQVLLRKLLQEGFVLNPASMQRIAQNEDPIYLDILLTNANETNCKSIHEFLATPANHDIIFNKWKKTTCESIDYSNWIKTKELLKPILLEKLLQKGFKLNPSSMQHIAQNEATSCLTTLMQHLKNNSRRIPQLVGWVLDRKKGPQEIAWRYEQRLKWGLQLLKASGYSIITNDHFASIFQSKSSRFFTCIIDSGIKMNYPAFVLSIIKQEKKQGSNFERTMGLLYDIRERSKFIFDPQSSAPVIEELNSINRSDNRARLLNYLLDIGLDRADALVDHAIENREIRILTKIAGNFHIEYVIRRIIKKQQENERLDLQNVLDSFLNTIRLGADLNYSNYVKIAIQEKHTDSLKTLLYHMGELLKLKDYIVYAQIAIEKQYRDGLQILLDRMKSLPGLSASDYKILWQDALHLKSGSQGIRDTLKQYKHLFFEKKESEHKANRNFFFKKKESEHKANGTNNSTPKTETDTNLNLASFKTIVHSPSNKDWLNAVKTEVKEKGSSVFKNKTSLLKNNGHLQKIQEKFKNSFKDVTDEEFTKLVSSALTHPRAPHTAKSRQELKKLGQTALIKYLLNALSDKEWLQVFADSWFDQFKVNKKNALPNEAIWKSEVKQKLSQLKKYELTDEDLMNIFIQKCLFLFTAEARKTFVDTRIMPSINKRRESLKEILHQKSNLPLTHLVQITDQLMNEAVKLPKNPLGNEEIDTILPTLNKEELLTSLTLSEKMDTYHDISEKTAKAIENKIFKFKEKTRKEAQKENKSTRSDIPKSKKTQKTELENQQTKETSQLESRLTELTKAKPLVKRLGNILIKKLTPVKSTDDWDTLSNKIRNRWKVAEYLVLANPQKNPGNIKLAAAVTAILKAAQRSEKYDNELKEKIAELENAIQREQKKQLSLIVSCIEKARETHKDMVTFVQKLPELCTTDLNQQKTMKYNEIIALTHPDKHVGNETIPSMVTDVLVTAQRILRISQKIEKLK